mmetsp:Transcript_17062/g.46103  ORF Transcript_17062/g.46103 Transcript_17062/m.46103 type:complete len:227 (+) Transcript_17062:23-703(+)
MAPFRLWALALALSPVVAAADFSFPSFFEGQWDMEKLEENGVVTRCSYDIKKQSALMLKGVYTEASAGGEIQMQVEVMCTSDRVGVFQKVNENGPNTDIFSFSFPPRPEAEVEVSQEADLNDNNTVTRVTTFTITSSSSFVLTVSPKGGAVRTWVATRRGTPKPASSVGKAPQGSKPAKAAAAGKRKSLFRRYGLYIALAIVLLLLRLAYESATKSLAAGGKAKAS